MAKASCPEMATFKKLADGKLPPPQVEPLVQHLETCASCFDKVRTLSPADTLLELIVKAKPVAGRAQEDLVARLIGKLTKTQKVNPITVVCTSCQRLVKVKAELAGKRIKCPGCGKPVAVPHEAAISQAGAVRPSSVEEQRTLPPTRAPDIDKRALPGKLAGQASDTLGETSVGNGRKRDATR